MLIGAKISLDRLPGDAFWRFYQAGVLCNSCLIMSFPDKNSIKQAEGNLD